MRKGDGTAGHIIEPSARPRPRTTRNAAGTPCARTVVRRHWEPAAEVFLPAGSAEHGAGQDVNGLEAR